MAGRLAAQNVVPAYSAGERLDQSGVVGGYVVGQDDAVGDRATAYSAAPPAFVTPMAAQRSHRLYLPRPQ